MFGIVIGTLCLVGLFKVLRHGRYHRYYGFYGPLAHARGAHGFGHSGYRGWGRRGGGLNWLFWRLETTHGQEKVILDEAETLRHTFAGLRGDVHGIRAAAASLMRGESLDGDALRGLWRDQDAVIAKARESLEVSLSRVHGALHADQRQAVARWLEQAGPFFGR